MIIKLQPQRSDETLVVSKRSDVLTINGERFDFRELPEGAVLPSSAVECDFVVGDITRQNGELIVTLLLPCGADASDAANFPFDIVSPPDGNVSLPQ
ncbi:hypothetical protein G7025_26620 [Pseudomonas lurida]|uniref:hypothetical protein n=1 Tax=Pseudomonas TaxID=286 RepID=UPI0015E392BF|nr:MULTISPECIES: hypothetical protein [Pseudomonas]MBA1296918.1 hypothetical protein [Pseudomonas lurida]